MENLSQRVRHGKRKNAQKKFEHPPNPVVYYSMNNLERIIEGSLGILGDSDLSPLPISKRFDARLHGAGINDEEYAGQRSNTGATVWWTPWSGGLQGFFARMELQSMPHWSRNHGNPCAEKGMHTRSQQLFFGGGETRHANAESLLTFGEISELRHPASISL